MAPTPDQKKCPVCDKDMNPEHAWWWTEDAAVCSEGCARIKSGKG